MSNGCTTGHSGCGKSAGCIVVMRSPASSLELCPSSSNDAIFFKPDSGVSSGWHAGVVTGV
jgi:hypothetical protein